MDGFKNNTKMKCFKEGGSVKYESRKEHKKEMSSDIKQDKKIVKKALAMHDKQEHPGEKTDLSKLKKGGRAKKNLVQHVNLLSQLHLLLQQLKQKTLLPNIKLVVRYLMSMKLKKILVTKTTSVKPN